MEKQTQQKSLAYPEIASFCGEMSMILKSGISALEGLELLMEDTQNELEKELINSMYQSMLEGHTFADALEQTHVFPASNVHRLYTRDSLASVRSSGSPAVIRMVFS